MLCGHGRATNEKEGKPMLFGTVHDVGRNGQQRTVEEEQLYNGVRNVVQAVDRTPDSTDFNNSV